MGNDFILVLGVLVGVMAFPSLVSSFSAGRSPRAAVGFFAVGGGLVSWAVYRQPGSYSVDGFPELALGVISQLFR